MPLVNRPVPPLLRTVGLVAGVACATVGVLGAVAAGVDREWRDAAVFGLLLLLGLADVVLWSRVRVRG